MKNEDITEKDVAGRIDHTLLKAEATKEQILRHCDEAREYGFCAVCVNGRWVSLAADRLEGTTVKVGAVAGFPLGADTTDIKVAQAREAIRNGADEIDMVADLAAIIENDAHYLSRQFQAMLEACRSMRPAATLKVIIEAAALTVDQKVFVCRIAQDIGVDFIKTSTGLHPAGGATVEDVRLMKETAPRCKIKAAGCIRTAQQAIAMIEAGADRIGSSAGMTIMKELRASGG
jgi:deoxyribose-phosphate aldolase